MIGVSLGAHISGFVGANMNGSIGRITGKPRSIQITVTLSCLHSLMSKDGDCCHSLKLCKNLEIRPKEIPVSVKRGLTTIVKIQSALSDKLIRDSPEHITSI